MFPRYEESGQCAMAGDERRGARSRRRVGEEKWHGEVDGAQTGARGQGSSKRSHTRIKLARQVQKSYIFRKVGEEMVGSEERK